MGDRITDISKYSREEIADLKGQLKVKPGQRSPETRAALREHGALVRELARSYPGSRRKKAKAVHNALSRYEANAWVRERGDAVCNHPPGSARALRWHILKTRNRVL